MSMTDPIADMLTRIRNAILAKHDEVNIPASRLKKNIAAILKEEGFIQDFQFIKDDKQGVLKVLLEYKKGNKCVIRGLKKISKPGSRVYVKHQDVPRVLNGLGVAIVSTSKGVLTDRACRRAGVGGEVLCHIW